MDEGDAGECEENRGNALTMSPCDDKTHASPIAAVRVTYLGNGTYQHPFPKYVELGVMVCLMEACRRCL